MVSWWGSNSYFNKDQIKIGDIKMITSAYGQSGSFGSGLRSKYI